MQSLRETAGEFLHLRRDRRRDLQRIGVGGLVDGDAGGGLAVELEILGVGLRAHLDARNVFNSNETAALRGLILDDDVGELVRIVETRQDVDRVLELLVLWRRRHADLPGRNLLALLLNSVDHVLRHQAERVQLLRVHPDPHRILAGPHYGHIADTRQARQLVDQVDRRVVPHVQGVVLAVRRVERHEFQDRRRFRADRDALRLHRLRQLRHGVLHSVLHQDLVKIRVGADLERHGQGVGAVVRAGRLHVDHARNPVDLQLDRQGNRVEDGLGACTGVAGGHLHRRRHDVRILRNRQA